MAYTNAVVKMVGEDGNAFAVMTRVNRALRRSGREDLIDSFVEDATSGDYNHLLQAVSKYVCIEGVGNKGE
jgi:hypothetical protein